MLPQPALPSVPLPMIELLANVATTPPVVIVTPNPLLRSIIFWAIVSPDPLALPPLPTRHPLLPFSEIWLAQTWTAASDVAPSTKTPLELLFENTQLRAVVFEFDLACRPFALPDIRQSSSVAVTKPALVVRFTPSPHLF